jgi:hypothetical protein
MPTLRPSRFEASLMFNAPSADPPEDLLTVEDLVARYRGLVARRTIDYWRYNKKGPPFIKVGRRVLYPLSGVIAWERKRTIHADLLKQTGV